MITLTNDAQDFLDNQMDTSPAGTLGIRIGLRDYGCSGFKYVVDFANEQATTDKVFTFGEKVRIFIAEEFVPAFSGMEIDYANAGAHSALQFNNPNVVHSCGCGSSFKFKE